MANLIKTPHPVTLEGQEKIAVHLNPGESLFSLLYRTVGAEQLDGEIWNVTVAGIEVPREAWHDCHPKDGQVIEVVGDMGRSALMMVAVIALTIWTGGMFAAVAAGGGIAGMGAVASYAVIAGIQVAGSLLINKVLGPKPPGSPDTTQGAESYRLGSTQNQARRYGAVPILFGRQRFAPDLLSQTYSYFDRDDMFLAMHVAWGIGVGRVENLRNGDTLLTDYDDAVTVWHSGFDQMTDQVIPLFGNADSQPGGSLQQNKVPLEVVRTTASETARVMVNISGSLFGVTRKGKLSMNQERFELSYRKAGSADSFVVGLSRRLDNDNRNTIRFTMSFDFPEVGQYDVRVRRLGIQSTGDGDTCEFSFDTMVSIQEDNSTYRGIARTGFTLRANERLSGQPTEVNGDAVAAPIPVWDGSKWVEEETDNPGAQMLKFIRGYYDNQGNLVAGLGEPDDMIDIEAFKAFMVHCRTNKFGYNFWLAKDRDHLEVLNSIAGVAMGQFTDSNGLYSVAWVSDDQAVDGTINMARIKKGTFRVDYSLIGTADGVIARFWDATTNAEATLRVPMPGVETMLSPASLTLEGVTNEAQAAILARYYLAQSLYQFKDVSFGVSLENLTFRRLSLLQVSHDMTQWGHGGVILRAASEGNAVALYLDEPVPAPVQGRQAYVGVRVPGQRAASVFKVKAFEGETRKLVLAEPWPADLKLPGNSDGNPAHDSIWIYDFKETPGLTARVTNIQRAVDRSATVNVVQESEQFWTYVRTGFYEPANSGSLLTTRPTASALTVTEQRNVLGDVVQEQLVVSWEVSGPYDESRVYTVESDGSLRERGRSNSRNLTFDIAGPGTYTVMVVPYNRQGLRGHGATATYSTLTVGAPPVLVDTFTVEELSGGVRRYSYGFFPDTMQSPDFAGVEIRMIVGSNQNPVWDAMVPLGVGFFTSGVDLVLPPAGTYTFACRSRNTGGVLSEGQRVVVKTLKANLGEQLQDVVSGVEQGKTDLAKEINDRINDVNAARDKATKDLTDKSTALQKDIDANAKRIGEQATQLQNQANDIKANTDGLAKEIIDRVNGDLNTRLELTTQITHETEQRESDVENLTRQLASIAAGSGEQFDKQAIWYFDTAGNLEGWTGVYGAPVVADGFLRPANNAAGQNTGIQSPVIALDGAAYRYLKMRVRWQGAPEWLGLVRWITDADRTWNDAKSYTIPKPSVGSNGIAVVDVADLPWNGASPIRAFRLALTNRQTDAANIAYDWIAVGRPSPGASMADVREEAQARIAADTAEASKRESLAVQMRGDYEGNDVAGLKSGLLANERDVRIQGDAVNAQAIQVVNARMPAGNGKLATEASVTSLQQATTEADKALGQRVDTLTAAVGNKADAAALEALRVEVNKVDGKTVANAQSITNLDSTLRAVSGQGSNLVRNGSIEQVNPSGGPAEFNLGINWSRNATEGRNGGACLKRSATATQTASSASCNNGETVWVEPGKTYRYSCWYRVSADWNGSPGNSKIRLANQGGGLIGQTPVFVVGRTEWTYLEGIYTVPTSGTVKGLKLTLVADQTVGDVWVQDVTLEEVTDFLANASAISGLTTKVAEVENGVKATAESLTKLDVSLGNSTVLTVIASASIASSPSGAPRSSGVYRPNWSALQGGNRGFNVAIINTDNTLSEMTRFDTHGSVGAGAEQFNTWLADKVQDNQYFVVFTSDATGGMNGTTPSVVQMRESLISCGGIRQNVEALGSSVMFAMIGRKGMGEGAAVQAISPKATTGRVGLYVIMPVTLVNGIPVTTGDTGRLSQESSANASAVQGLTTEVGKVNGRIDAQATLLTQLRTDVNDVTTKTNANTTAVGQLTTRTTAVEGKVETMGNQVTKLQSDMSTSILSGDNRVQDGSFETRKAGDVYGSGVITDKFARSGTKALSVAATGNIRDVSVIEFRTNGERVMYCEVYVRNDPDNPLTTGTGDGTLGIQATVRRIDGSVSYPNVQVIAAANVGAAWTKLSGYVVCPADVWSFIARLTIRSGVKSGNVIFDDVFVTDATDGYNAQQTANANATAVQGLTTRVEKAEGQLTTTASSLVDLAASINSIGGDNLLPNASYEEFTASNGAPTGYVTEGNMSAMVNSFVSSPLSGGGRAFRREGKSTAVGQYVGLAKPSNTDFVTVTPNTDYTISTYVRATPGAILRMYIQWRNATGSTVATTTTPDYVVPNDGWARVVYPARTTNAGVLTARVFTGRLFSTAAAGATADYFMELDNVQFQQGKTATEWQPSGKIAAADIAATATAVSGLTTTVNQQGTKLDATAQDLVSLKTQVGNVNATAFSQLQTTVNQQGTKIDTQAQQINGLQVSMGGKADAAVVQTMEAQIKNQGFGGNLIGNSLFPDWSGSGWVDPSQFGGMRNVTGTESFIPYGVRSAAAGVRGGPWANGSRDWGWTDNIPVTPGKTYSYSMYVNTHRCRFQAYVEWKNSANQTISTMAAPMIGHQGKGKEGLAAYARPFAIGKAPDGAVTASCIFMLEGTGESEPYYWFWYPMLCEVAEGATQPPPFTASGAQAYAQWAVNVRADGRVGGLVLASNGQTSSFDIVADQFRISNPGNGGRRTEYSDGHWRVYRDNGSLILRMGTWN